MVKNILFPTIPTFVFIFAIANQALVFAAEATKVQETQQTKVSAKRIQELRKHAKENNYSTRYGIFADLSQNSGLKRLFVVNLENNTLIEQALVTHGHCKEDEEKVRFSNTAETNCSSEGKYSIGKSYHGIFGLAYKLHGLDKTNSNAFARHIVLHAHECVYDQTWPTEICESEGCPTVSPKVLLKLKKLIESEKKPILLWIYKTS